MADLPETPSPALVQSYIDLWEGLENYVLQEKSLSLLFEKLCPRNTSIDAILLKVSALNDFYSTNIYNTYAVAKHILSLDVDARLQSGDLELVDDIARVKGLQRVVYSFSTKYCSHHQPDRFPIYDSYVEQMLDHFRKRDCFGDFRKADLKRYEVFYKAIQLFRDHYGLSAFSIREIDIYLWQAGKKHFPKSYGKRK
jgi:hypothetical protein